MTKPFCSWRRRRLPPRTWMTWDSGCRNWRRKSKRDRGSNWHRASSISGGKTSQMPKAKSNKRLLWIRNSPRRTTLWGVSICRAMIPKRPNRRSKPGPIWRPFAHSGGSDTPTLKSRPAIWRPESRSSTESRRKRQITFRHGIGWPKLHSSRGSTTTVTN